MIFINKLLIQKEMR